MSGDRPSCTCVICSDYGDRDRLDNFQLRTIVHITQYGWSVVLVQPDTDGPGWAYTIGLWHSHRVPELAMFGGDVYETEEVLNALGKQAAEGTPRPTANAATASSGAAGRVPGRRPALVRRAAPRRRRVLPASAAAGPPGRLAQPARPVPLAAGHRPVVPARQPWLWLNPKQHPIGVWTRRL